MRIRAKRAESDYGLEYATMTTQSAVTRASHWREIQLGSLVARPAGRLNSPDGLDTRNEKPWLRTARGRSPQHTTVIGGRNTAVQL